MGKEQTLDKLWYRYKQTKDGVAKESLIEEYAPLVKYVAGRLAIHMPDSVELDDLISYGVFGLLDALEKFEPERNIKFETYASSRIRGAILDGLRSTDWIPRSVRAKARQMEKEISRLTNDLGRRPSDLEVAAALDVPMDKYYSMLDEVKTTSVLSLDELINSDSSDEPIKMLDVVPDPEGNVDKELLSEELHNALAEAIDALPERERTVISLYYRDGLTLKEIGHVLDVSESRVCQIHTKAILTLRSELSWL